MKRGDLGAKIASLREAQGWTQAELARRVRVDPSYIPRIEQGDRLPSIALMSRFATVFSSSLADLLSELPAARLSSHPRLKALESESGVELVSRALEAASKNWTEADWREFDRALSMIRDSHSHSKGTDSRWRAKIPRTSSG